MVQLIVFDLAGTTVLDADAVNHTLKQALAAAGVRASRDQINALMGQPTATAIADLLAAFRGQAAASADAVDAVLTDFVQRMVWHYESHPHVAECDGASDLFAWCHRHGVLTAIGSGLPRTVANAAIARMGWRERGLIDATITSDEVPRGRPHPDMVERLMTVTGVTDPLLVAKVGDTPMDIREGQAAGCRFVIGVTSGTHSAEALRTHAPTHLIAELLEIPDLLAEAEAGAA